MPMSPRLLRPRANNLDQDAAVYLNAVAAADGQQLESAVRKAINDFVVGCKRDGIWTAIKASCILMGARTLSGALTPLVGAAPTNNNFVSGDYNRKTGLVGNGSTKYLDSNRANNADPQNSNHISVYVTAAPTANGAHIASGAGLNGVNQIVYDSGSGLLVRNRVISGFGSTLASTNPTGLIGHSRAASGSYTIRASGSNSTASLTSQTPNSGNIHLYQINGFPGYVSNGRLAFYSIGESLTLSLLDDRLTTLYNAIGAAIP